MVKCPRLLLKPYHERGLHAVSTVALPKQQLDSAYLNFRFNIGSLNLATDVPPVFDPIK